MNIEQAKLYPKVRAKAGTTVSVYKKSDYQSNGTVLLSSKLTSFAGGENIGVIQVVYTMKSGNHLALIQLEKPYVNWFVGYSHVLAFIDNLEPIGETGVINNSNTYYSIGNDVNIRKTPSLTGAKFPSKLNKGDIIGTSDGVVSNNFLKFNLRIGGVGYVSKTYVTLQAPTKAAVTKSIVTVDPKTGEQTNESVPVILQPDSQIDYTRIIIGSVVGVVVGWIFTKIINSFSK